MSTARITASAETLLDTVLAEGHSVQWGRATDGRTAFFWARVTPHRSASVRNVKAGDTDSLMAKVADVARSDPSGHVVGSFADPLRHCERCGAELSFDAESRAVFACARAGTESGHTEIVPL
ncbi:MAG: hypothetical protein R3290_06905 [Acidimicrobiia bacterium]|nr:hypothetical protein [Acidimicrobiia bacterium]